jgi:spore germination protein GerM
MNVKPVALIRILAAMAIALTLAGCSSLSFVPERANESRTLPPVQDDGLTAPVGDSIAEHTGRFTLNYIGSDQQALVAVSRTMRLTGEGLLAEKVMERLLDPPDTLPGVLPIAPPGTRLLWVEQSEGVATVNLSVDVLSLTEQELTWMRVAIANTLIGNDGIQYVNVLVGGKEESALSLPSGTLFRTDGNLTALWAQQQADQERLSQPDARLDRSATLYFSAPGGAYLLPEVRAVRLLDDNYARTLIEELSAGGDNGRVLPEGDFLTADPTIDTLDDGRRVVTLNLDAGFEDMLRAQELSPGLAYGTLTLTLCRFVPEIDALRVVVGGEALGHADLKDRVLTPADGVISPEDFDSLIGRVAKVYLTDQATGELRAVRRPLERRAALSARVLMEQVLEGPAAYEAGVLPVAAQGIGRADIEGVRIEEGVALVNLSGNFYRSCQQMSESAERNLVYALVNTLCELDAVEKVRFFIEGQSIDALVTSICLRSALLPNPGIVVQ